jgi:16S rRNA (guanine527-N7)-methyltransferase
MREPAATPIIRREDRKVARRSIFRLSDTDARRALVSLERLLSANALALPDRFADDAERYVGLLLEANARLNLTRVTEPDAIARLHLLDALAALPLIDAMVPRRALDIGSGGGVPGIILALARPSISWTLVDSVAKKADVLRTFVAALGTANVEVVARRAELLGHDPLYRERYDLVTARACAPLPVLVEYALPLLAVNGLLIAWKGPITDAELDAGAAASAVLGGSDPTVHPTGQPALGDHRLVLITKRRATPERFPRPPGQPSRRPLPF